MQNKGQWRAKSKNFGWVYGDLIVFKTKDISNEVNEYRGIYDEKSREIFDITKETIGQNSTVKDKNGIEMYEGDIVYGAARWLERYKPAVVTFRNGSFGLLWHRGDVEEFNPFTSLCNVEYEVVGNIYDNLELTDIGR